MFKEHSSSLYFGRWPAPYVFEISAFAGKEPGSINAVLSFRGSGTSTGFLSNGSKTYFLPSTIR